MSDALYFQWQNDVLRKSIYPLREMKLRDFLVYFREIELWKEYEHKDISGEVNDYRAKKKQAIRDAVDLYFKNKEYVSSLDAKTDYAQYLQGGDWITDEVITGIENMRKTFNTYLDGYRDKPRHETYFLSQRVANWLEYRKNYMKRVASKQRRVDVLKANGTLLSTPVNELNRMKNFGLKMIDSELEHLYAFVSASGKIEKRRLDLIKALDDANKVIGDANVNLKIVEPKIEAQTVLIKQLQAELERFKAPPELASSETYFSIPNSVAQIREMFAQASNALVEVIGNARREMFNLLNTSKPAATKLKIIKNAIDNLSKYRKDILAEILKLDNLLKTTDANLKRQTDREKERSGLRDISLKVVDEEINRLSDYYVALDHSKKTKSEWGAVIKEKEKELASAGEVLSKLQDQAKELRDRIDLYDDISNITFEVRLKEFDLDSSKPITVKEIVQARVDEYKSSLMDKDHYQLLELVVDEFKSEPGRYPRWLQYMVIHFSGMRYASAHGSWADPKDLLANLGTSSLEKEVDSLSDEELSVLCEDRLEHYDPASVFTDEKKTDLATTTDEEWVDKINEHRKLIKRGLDMNSPYHQRQALLNLRIDEENYKIDQMPSAKVYEELMTFKDKLPEWMWHEIVRMTELRVTQVDDENWEKPQGLPAGYTRQDLQFRTMLEEWKKKFLTGWREEHDQSDKLIVSRAVCNEVAEHIQHLRGLKPGGGLTAKPTWYQSTEGRVEGAYFVKPESGDDFKPGASILWLRFVRKKPNEWQEARPIATKRDKYELLPPSYNGRKGSSWSYDKGGSPIRRWRRVAAVGGGDVQQEEWLRWMHEATVVEMAKTAEGDMVLTFETALPGDDPRLSTIGVFKRRLSDLTDDGQEDAYHRAFVGFIPEGEMPEQNLKEMLDWKKILARPAQQVMDERIA